MLDVHCHLLPGIDDGAHCLKDALELARYSVACGITRAVMTPHIQPGQYNNSSENIAAAVDSFRSALLKHDIALQIAAGAEVRVCPEIMDMVAAGHIPFLGESEGYKVMLLEFPHSHILPGSEQLVSWLMEHHIRPLIAHPERNKGIHANPDKIIPFMSMGCLLQVTAGSVVGSFGKSSRLCAEYFLNQGWVEILATDAHNIQYRPPDLLGGLQAASALIGEDAAHKLVYENAWAIAGDRFDS